MSLGLYIHLPFCASKCLYCDFNSQVYAQELQSLYVKALLKEMRYYAEDDYIKHNLISTVFIGGGTPTFIARDLLFKIMAEVEELFQLSENVEWSMEANPGTIDLALLQELRKLGLNRISLGVQSFDSVLLKRLGRSHSALQAETAVLHIKQAGFTNFNLDLMYGLPGQSLAIYYDTLQQAIDLQPTHLSLYGLQVEEGTPFGILFEQGQLELPDEDEHLAMIDLSHDLTQKAGFNHYEISNYAKTGHSCQHNLIYWHNLEYVGIGAGAYSYLKKHRYGHIASAKAYVEHWGNSNLPLIEDDELLDMELECAETLMLGFRLLEGVDTSEIERRFMINFEHKYGMILEDLLKRGLIEKAGSLLRLSTKGLPLANVVCGAFLPD